jgi:hypothetical protein
MADVIAASKAMIVSLSVSRRPICSTAPASAVGQQRAHMFEPSDVDIDAGPHIEPPVDFGIRRLTQRTFLVELVLAKDLFDQFCALTKKAQRDSHYYLPQGCHADGAVVTDPPIGEAYVVADRIPPTVSLLSITVPGPERSWPRSIGGWPGRRPRLTEV